LASIYLFTHRIDEAVAVLEQLLKSNPGNGAVLMRLGDTYTYAGQPERGIALLRQVYQLDPRYSGIGHAFIGRGLLLLNRHEEAIAETQDLRPAQAELPTLPRGGRCRLCGDGTAR
jgi:tetratricopeptide (TPR) repeat protein